MDQLIFAVQTAASKRRATAGAATDETEYAATPAPVPAAAGRSAPRSTSADATTVAAAPSAVRSAADQDEKHDGGASQDDDNDYSDEYDGEGDYDDELGDGYDDDVIDGDDGSAGTGGKPRRPGSGRSKRNREPEDKTVRRREMNRMNAKASRMRKKVFMDALNGRLRELEAEVNVLSSYMATVLRIDPRDVLAGRAPMQHQQSTAASSSAAAAVATAGLGQQVPHQGSGAAAGQIIITSADASGVEPAAAAVMQAAQAGTSHQQQPGGAAVAWQAASSPSSAAAAAAGSASAAAMDTYPPSGAGAASSSFTSAAAPSTSSFSHSQGGLGVMYSRIPVGMPPPASDLIQSVERVRDSFIITDPAQPDCPIVWASPGFLQLTGYSYAEVLGKNCRFLQCPGSDPAVISSLRASIIDPREFSCVILNRRKDGSLFWNALTCSPLFDAVGKVVAFVGIQADVSPRVPTSSGDGSSTASAPVAVPEVVSRQAKADAQRLLSAISEEAHVSTVSPVGSAEYQQQHAQHHGHNSKAVVHGAAAKLLTAV